MILIAFIIVAGFFFWIERDVISGIVPLLLPSPKISNESMLQYTLPDGFVSSTFSYDTPGVRVLAFDPNGVLVASLTSEGKIVALPDQDVNGKADTAITILSDLQKPHGIVFRCLQKNACTLYIAVESAVLAYDYDALNKEVKFRERIADLPSGRGHFTRTLLLHPDGKRLLVSVGSSCNVCREADARRASILSVDLDTKMIKPFATGLRNTVFMTVRPDNQEIWGTDMGRDFLGDDTPPDEINVISENNDLGWPYCYGKNIRDTTFGDSGTNLCVNTSPSKIDIPAHSAPLGLAFIPKSWPLDYHSDILVAYHGSWNRSEPTGYKIVRVELDPSGEPTGAITDFMTGFISSGKILGRPVDVLFGQYGELYVSDDRAGAIYKISKQ